MNLKEFLIADHIDEGMFSSEPKKEAKPQNKAAGLVFTSMDRYLSQTIATHNSINSGVVGKMMDELNLHSEKTKMLRSMNDIIRILEDTVPSVKKMIDNND